MGELIVVLSISRAFPARFSPALVVLVGVSSVDVFGVLVLTVGDPDVLVLRLGEFRSTDGTVFSSTLSYKRTQTCG